MYNQKEGDIMFGLIAICWFIGYLVVFVVTSSLMTKVLTIAISLIVTASLMNNR